MTKRRKVRSIKQRRAAREITDSASLSSQHPPRLAERILHFVLPRDQREATIGDLSEEFQKLQPIFGKRWAANAWYLKEAAILLVKQILKVIKLIGYGWMEEFIRRNFS